MDFSSVPDHCEKVFRNVLNKMPFFDRTSSADIDEYAGYSDSAGDESTDNWLTSPASSQGCSSISSIPWAEDAIKQNQEEWEAIEQMLYGELPLPTNQKIREEFEEWMAKFPHIRVVGRQILHNAPGHARISLGGQYDRDEMLAIDPPIAASTHRPYISTASSMRAKLPNEIRSSRDNRAIGRSETDLQSEIEQCLRITSGPLLSRRWQQLSGNTKGVSHRNEPQPQHIFNMSPPENNGSSNHRVGSVRSDTFNPHHRYQQLLPIYPEDSSSPERRSAMHLPITLTATLMKMPPILSIAHYQPEKHAYATARSTLQRRRDEKTPVKRVTLPAIATVPSMRRDSSFHTELIGRSISAVNQCEPRYSRTATVRYRAPSTALREF